MAADERPSTWVGHVALGTSDVEKTADFFAAIGMRVLERSENVAILELRGGTHLVVLPAGSPALPGTKAPFDLMFDDIDAIRARCVELGLSPSEIEEAHFHRAFRVVEPGGHEVTMNSSHVSGQPV